jgi:hypothetical protein
MARGSSVGLTGACWCHIVGDVSEMIHVAQAVMHAGAVTLRALDNVPTWTDAYKYAAFDAGAFREAPGDEEGA